MSGDQSVAAFGCHRVSATASRSTCTVFVPQALSIHWSCMYKRYYGVREVILDIKMLLPMMLYITFTYSTSIMHPVPDK